MHALCDIQVIKLLRGHSHKSSERLRTREPAGFAGSESEPAAGKASEWAHSLGFWDAIYESVALEDNKVFVISRQADEMAQLLHC